jgi:hypothetical protein
MVNPMTLPIVAGLSIAGAAFGVYLGNSAISEINPAYYGTPEPKFHADLAPYRSPDWAQVQVAEETAMAGGLGAGCVKCRAYPEEYVPVADSRPDGREDGYAASAPYALADPPPVEEEAADPEWERVATYASYPIRSDEEADDMTDAGDEGDIEEAGTQ